MALHELAMLLLALGDSRGQPWRAPNCVQRKCVAVDPVAHGHVEWRGSCTPLSETVDMKVVMVGAIVSELVND